MGCAHASQSCFRRTIGLAEETLENKGEKEKRRTKEDLTLAIFHILFWVTLERRVKAKSSKEVFHILKIRSTIVLIQGLWQKLLIAILTFFPCLQTQVFILASNVFRKTAPPKLLLQWLKILKWKLLQSRKAFWVGSSKAGWWFALIYLGYFLFPSVVLVKLVTQPSTLVPPISKVFKFGQWIKQPHF